MPSHLGVNAWVWISPFTTNEFGLLDKVKKMGFETFEFGLEEPEDIDAGKLKDKLAATGLRVVICGAFGPSRDLTSDNPAHRQESLDYITTAVKLAEKIGSKIIGGPMYSAVGKRRHISADQKKQEWDLAVKGLKQAAKIAGDHGIKLAIEPLNRFETDLVNTAEQGMRLIRDIDSKQVGVHLDTFHMNIEEKDSYAAIKLAGSQLLHFHTCENDRGAPGSGKNIDWEGVAKGLREISYDGDAVIESFTPSCSIAGAAAIWRPLARTQDDLATEGLAFLKKTM